MRTLIAVSAALGVSACAGAPPTAQAPVKMAYAATDAPAASTLEEAQKLGYTVVDDQGRTLICREWRKLGSRIQKERVCLTEAEFNEARAQHQRTSEFMKAPGPIPFEGPTRVNPGVRR